MMEKRQRGRPDTHLSDHAYALRMPHSLYAQMKAAAHRVGISVSEAWRRAAAAWLTRPPQ